MHKHKCRYCDFVWQHSDSCALISSEMFDESHTCPVCGATEQTEKYFGEQQPEIVQNCAPAGLLQYAVR